MPRNRALKGTNVHPRDTGSFVPYLEQFGKFVQPSENVMNTSNIQSAYLQYIQLQSDSISTDSLKQAASGFRRAFKPYAIRNKIKESSKPRGYYITIPKSLRKYVDREKTTEKTPYTMFEKKFINKKVGFGVFASCDMPKDMKIVEYKGQWITEEEHCEREEFYARNNLPPVAVHDPQSKKVLDANRDQNGIIFCSSDNIARYFNHSKVTPNCKLVPISEGRTKRCFLVTNSCIPSGSQLLWDYADNNLENISANPWLLS